MTKKILLVLAGMLIGCAAAVGMETVSAQNNEPAYGDSPAQSTSNSGQTQYRECFRVSVASFPGGRLNSGRMPDTTVQVPAGWTPVGGTSDGMILCR